MRYIFDVHTGSYHGHSYIKNDRTIVVKGDNKLGYQGRGRKNVVINVHQGNGDGYKGFNFVDGRFSYKGVDYQLKCGKKRFLNLWKRCFGLYNSRSICFGRLQKQQLFVVYTSGSHHGNGYQEGQKNVFINVHTEYEDGYQEFNVVDRRFSYKGVAYQLKCNEKNFQSLWKRCYGLYHSKNICFDRLRKQQLFVIYTSGGQHGHGYQGGQKHVVIDVEQGYQGFKVVGRRFSYKGVAYRLKCGKERFVSLWKRCYGVKACKNRN